MTVNLLDLNGNTNKSFIFNEVFPIETMPLNFNMLKQNEYLTYQVLFMFRDFTFK